MYINEQVHFYLTSMNVLQSYIIETGIIYDSLIVRYEIPSSYIPVVKYKIWLKSIKYKVVDNRRNILSIFIDNILLEMRKYLITLYNITMKE